MVDYTAASGYTTDGSGRRQYVDRNDANGVQGTYLIADDRNMDRNELVNAVKASGQALSAKNHGQLLLAIQALGNIRPWSNALSDAIGGYWLGAVVMDSSGDYWKSMVSANTTVPGESGANWKSLFDGYATSDQLGAEISRAGKAEGDLSTAISTVATNLNTEAQTRANNDALKANLAGGNALTGNQTISGGGVFRVVSTLDGSSMYTGMDGSSAGQAILVVADAEGNITNVLRLDGADLSVNPGTNVRVTSKVDGSFCRFAMDGGTGTMADLILVNPSGAIANVLRVQSDGYASVNAGRLAVLSDRFPVQFQNSVSNASAISTSLSFTAARSGWMSLHLGSGHNGSFTFNSSSTSYSSNVTALSESQHVAFQSGGSPWLGNFLYRFTAGAVNWSSTITWGGTGELSLSGIGTVYYDE